MRWALRQVDINLAAYNLLSSRAIPSDTLPVRRDLVQCLGECPLCDPQGSMKARPDSTPCDSVGMRLLSPPSSYLIVFSTVVGRTTPGKARMLMNLAND